MHPDFLTSPELKSLYRKQFSVIPRTYSFKLLLGALKPLNFLQCILKPSDKYFL